MGYNVPELETHMKGQIFSFQYFVLNLILDCNGERWVFGVLPPDFYFYFFIKFLLNL